MAITLRRQISNDEKERILKVHGRFCYATGHPIPEDQIVQYDHIKAFTDNGQSEIDNIAPMCELHNKQKGTLPLFDFRIRLKMDEFFEKGEPLTLKDQLEFLKKNGEITQYGNPVNIIKEDDSNIEIEVNNRKKQYALYQCPITQWKYFYGILPIEVLDSDDDKDKEIGLQPRYLIFTKVFDLFRHFQRYPVLQPSICRINKGKILVFDGQHKIAALLWGNRREFECKVYLNPDPNLLNKANIAAHDKYCQTRFFSSIMVEKLGGLFKKEFDEYIKLEDDKVKSESEFVHYLKEKERLTQGEVNKRFRSSLFNAVLSDKENRISRLVSNSNRSTAEYPLTIDMLQKSLLAVFLYNEPLDHDLHSEKYLRGQEFNNVIRLFNILDEEALSRWNSKASDRDPLQLKLNRMFRSKSIMAWSEIYRDAVCAKLNIFDGDQKVMPFYRNMSESDFASITFITRRLTDWKIWDLPPDSELDRILADNKSKVKEWFKEKGLTTGYLMGAPE
jgi:hypothetical protein